MKVKQIEIEKQTFYQRKIQSNYIHILVNKTWILEHRFLVSEFIDRPLDKNEVVHHISFNKLDNRMENLFLFKSQREHKHFENQVIQFGWTNPLIRKVRERWDIHRPMIQELKVGCIN